MTEQSRIITEEQWREYQMLKRLHGMMTDYKLAEEIHELYTQLEEANDTLVKSQNMTNPDRNNFVAQYLMKWGVK